MCISDLLLQFRHHCSQRLRVSFMCYAAALHRGKRRKQLSALSLKARCGTLQRRGAAVKVGSQLGASDRHRCSNHVSDPWRGRGSPRHSPVRSASWLQRTLLRPPLHALGWPAAQPSAWSLRRRCGDLMNGSASKSNDLATDRCFEQGRVVLGGYLRGLVGPTMPSSSWTRLCRFAT